MTYSLKRPDGTSIEATEEQVLIIEAGLKTKDNLLINALAGSAKTTTLEFLAKYMPIEPMLSLAFNKRIAVEMEARLPGHVMCKTLNSIGHRTWGAAIGKSRLMVDAKKSSSILKGLIDDKLVDRSDAYEFYGDILRAVSMAKSVGYVPEGAPPHAKRLIEKADFFGNLEEDPPQDIVDAILIKSIAQSYQGFIDFDDQIYMPTLFGGAFPRFPTVLVDEAQDLSPLNHNMLIRLNPGRLLAVGDPWQSIYAFRGAAVGSMGLLRGQFSMKEMTLSMSFRCPKAIVRNAHWRVPHFKWAPWAEEGSVHAPESWSAAEIPEGSAIICRNNAPLISCAMGLLKAGRPIHVVGSDLGPGIIKALKRLGPELMTRKEVLSAIQNWKTQKLKSSKNPGRVEDRADCLEVFASFGETLRGAIHYAEHIFNSKGPIQLLSGHKAKGLEWDTVYHLDPWRIPSKYSSDLDQEYNVRYVIETRAKKNLFLVRMENLNA